MLEVDPKDGLSEIPTPMLIVTAESEGERNGMAVGCFSLVSYRPLLVMISIRPETYTYELIEKSGEFAINVVSERQKEVLLFFGSKSGREVDKFKAMDVKTFPASKIKAPLIEDSPCSLECKLVSKLPAGRDTILVGEVVAAHKNENKGRPLLWYRKKWGKFVYVKALNIK